jgi:hypothetical protein
MADATAARTCSKILGVERRTVSQNDAHCVMPHTPESREPLKVNQFC